MGLAAGWTRADKLQLFNSMSEFTGTAGGGGGVIVGVKSDVEVPKPRPDPLRELV